jgi:diketogulonate reductase-like aldo/keto reductase
LELVVKIGRAGRTSPGALQADVAYALKELGTAYLDVVMLCALRPGEKIEAVMRHLGALLGSGVVRAVGICASTAQDLRRARNAGVVHVVEAEFSLWCREPAARALVDECARRGVRLLARAPFGRSSAFAPGAERAHAGAESDDADQIAAVADFGASIGCSLRQVALAYLNTFSPTVTAIPCAASVAQFDEHLAARTVVLTEQQMQHLDALVPMRCGPPVTAAGKGKKARKQGNRNNQRRRGRSGSCGSSVSTSSTRARDLDSPTVSEAPSDCSLSSQMSMLDVYACADDGSTRIAPDGGRFTRQEFVEYYGGAAEWEAAVATATGADGGGGAAAALGR